MGARQERTGNETKWYDSAGVVRRRDLIDKTKFYDESGNLKAVVADYGVALFHTNGTTALVTLYSDGLTMQISDGTKKITLDTTALQFIVSEVSKAALQAGRLGLANVADDSKKVDINTADVTGTASFKSTGVCDDGGTSAKFLRGDVT
jgi:hypothetical protein